MTSALHAVVILFTSDLNRNYLQMDTSCLISPYKPSRLANGTIVNSVDTVKMIYKYLYHPYQF